MGVARGQAEQAGENRESSHPGSPAGVQIRVDKEEYLDLRWAAAYWKAQHREAVEREADLKSDNEELRARIRELEGRLYGRRSGVHLEPVLSRSDSALWNEYIDRYHYLGYPPELGGGHRGPVRPGAGCTGKLSSVKLSFMKPCRGLRCATSLVGRTASWPCLALAPPPGKPPLATASSAGVLRNGRGTSNGSSTTPVS